MKIISALIETTIYSAIIFVVIMMFKSIFCNKISPGLHCAIWFVLIAKLCFPFTVESGFHFFAVNDHVQSIIENLAIVEEVPMIGAALYNDADFASEIILPDNDTAFFDAQTKETVTTSQFRITLAQAIIAVWVIGMALSAVKLLIARLKFNRMIQHCSIAPAKRILKIYEKCCNDLNIRHPLPIRIITGVFSPVITISMCPKIILPYDICIELTDEQLIHSIAHELTHYRRRDHLLSLLLRLLEIVYWFNPIVWLLKRQIVKDMECACDSFVTAAYDKANRREYALTLLKLFSQTQKNSYMLAMARTSSEEDVERRMRGIFNSRKSRTPVKMIAVVLCASLFVTCFTTACQPTPDVHSIEQKGDILDAIMNTPDASLPTPTSATSEVGTAKSNNSIKYENVGKWQESFSIGKCDVEIDADILMPSGTNIAVSQVLPYEFKNPDIDRFLDIFFPNQIVKNYAVKSATDIESEMLYYKQLLSQLKEGIKPENEPRPIDILIDECERAIDELEQEYKAIGDSQIQEGSLRKEFVRAGEYQETADFYGKNSDGEAYLLTLSNMDEVGSMLNYSAHNYGSFSPIDESESVNAASGLDLESILSNAQSIMDKLRIADYYLSDKIIRKLTTPDMTTKYVYALRFTRTYGSLPFIPISVAPVGVSSESQTGMQYSRKAFLESFQIFADNEKIYVIEWRYPYTVEQIYNQNVATISQEEVKDAVKRYLDQSLAIIDTKTVLHISELVLSSTYLTMKDHPGNYLTIPVWDLIGYQTTEDGSVYLGGTDALLSFATINAVDATVVNRTAGY